MSALIGMTRDVSPAIARCELTHLSRVPIDADTARAQHREYERALARLGCTVERVPAGADMPDSVFIEDVAVVLDEIAILTRPGTASRRRECPAVEQALASYRELARIEAPGTLDGGDVLVIGRAIYIGASSRTNDAAVEQVRKLAAPFGYMVHAVGVRGCLHLKSAVTAVDEHVLLMNREWASSEVFRRFDIIDVHRDEPYAANVVRVGERLLYPEAYPNTRRRLEDRDYDVTSVDVSELAKAEGAVTCCSLIFRMP